MSIGQRVKDLRIERGLNQPELAKAVGCTQQVISNIERGYSGARPQIIKSLAVFFGVPVDYIVGTTDCRSSDYIVIESDDERDLIENFRRMSKKQKRIFLGEMEDLLDKE